MINNIFHQVVRYDYAQRVINAMRTEKKHTILEVGAGAHGNLAKYLPQDEILFLDIDLPSEVLKDRRFVIGDATDLVYEDEAFDFVIALDVIEHIPIEKRLAFIENISRVAKKGVILSAPFDDESEDVDQVLKSFYHISQVEPPIWVDEHITCKLPTEKSINELIYAQGVDQDHLAVFYGVKKSLMEKMLIMECAASKYPQLEALFNIVNEDYVKRIMSKDIFLQKTEAIKLYAVWSKETTADDVKASLIMEQYNPDYDMLAKVEKQYTDLMQIALQLVADKQAIEEDIFINIKNDILGQINLRHNALDTCVSTVASEQKEMLRQLLRNVERVDRQQNDILEMIRGNDEVKLNVILITYNHEQFIRETLETILSQKTSFKFNIIVADDCSTDNTVEIIREVEKTTDIPFVFLTNDKNLGIMQNYKRAFAHCNASYVAIMEGDDLWTDNLRLEKHVDFLDAHCECSMTFNRYIVKNFEEGTTRLQPVFSQQEEALYFRYVNGHDLAYNNLIGNFSTCVYRASALKALPEQLYSMKAYDWLTNILISRMGVIGCLMQPMSIYRIHSKGVWSSQSQDEQIKSMIEAIEIYDEYTEYEFTGGFTAHKNRLCANLMVAEIPVKITCLERILKKICKIKNYVPPIFIYVIKLLVPNIILEKIRL